MTPEKYIILTNKLHVFSMDFFFITAFLDTAENEFTKKRKIPVISTKRVSL